jgi:hypothetical protein
LVVEQPGGCVAGVLEVRLVDDERAGGRELDERAGRVVRPAAERERRVVVAELGAGEPGGDAEERVGRLVGDGDAVARSREGARAEEDQVVCARAEDDVLGADARVLGDRLVDVRVPAVRVGVDAGERVGEHVRLRPWRRARRRVAVEADDLVRRDPGSAGDVRGGRGPGVRREVARERPHGGEARRATGWVR